MCWGRCEFLVLGCFGKLIAVHFTGKCSEHFTGLGFFTRILLLGERLNFSGPSVVCAMTGSWSKHLPCGAKIGLTPSKAHWNKLLSSPLLIASTPLFNSKLAAPNSWKLANVISKRCFRVLQTSCRILLTLLEIESCINR